MIRLVVAIAIVTLAFAWAGAGSSLVAAEIVDDTTCSETQPEHQVRTGVVSDSPTVHFDFVAPDALHQMPAGARIVDVRRLSRHSPWRPEGVLALTFLELRVLAGRAEHPVYVFGNGYDDDRIARRIARWKPSETEWARVVRGGAVGLAMAQSELIERAELKRLLAVPVQQVAAVGRQAVVSWLGSPSVPADLTDSGVEWRDDALQSASEMIEWAQAFEDDASIVLAGDDPSRVGGMAVDTSIALSRPVFYIDGNRAAIEQQIDHHARLVQGRSRVGDVPCG